MVIGVLVMRQSSSCRASTQQTDAAPEGGLGGYRRLNGRGIPSFEDGAPHDESRQSAMANRFVAPEGEGEGASATIRAAYQMQLVRLIEDARS